VDRWLATVSSSPSAPRSTWRITNAVVASTFVSEARSKIESVDASAASSP
jgi:hypothetical protein